MKFLVVVTPPSIYPLPFTTDPQDSNIHNDGMDIFGLVSMIGGGTLEVQPDLL